MKRALLACWMLLAGALSAQAQELSGRWQVAYADAVLGPVDGWAQFDEKDNSVFVRYADPRSGEIVPADGTFTRLGNSLQVVLRGRSPAADPILPLPGQVLNAAVPGEAGFSLEQTKIAVPVSRPRPPVEQETRLELLLAEDGLSAAGEWRQSVDPASRRNSARGGRNGALRLLYDGAGGAEMRGAETWYRPQLAFVTAFALQDQFAAPYDEPSWPEPFAADGKLKRPLADRRMIFVLGRDLPGTGAGSVEIESDDPNVSYGVHALPSDLRKPSAADGPWVERGWRMLGEHLPPERVAELRKFDVMILSATLKPDALAGARTFRINGQEAAWHLQFGDWRGRLSIGRPLGFGQTADTDFIYPQERVQFEILLDREIPKTSLTVIPGVIHAAGGATFGVGGERTVLLRRDASQPHRYVSDPVVISDPAYADSYPPGTPIMVALPGDRIVVELGEEPIVALRPAIDSAELVPSPRHVAGALSGKKAKRGRLWLDALKAAALCHGLDSPNLTGFDSLRRETFERRIVFAWRKLSQDIALGEHAAAILLRDVFVEMLRGQAQHYEKPLSDEEILGFRRLVRDAVWSELKPLGHVQVELPGGRGDSFAASFLDDLMKERHGLEGEALRRWRIDATRQARLLYAQAIKRSIEIATEAEDCDTEKLLALTGRDFEPVRHVAKQLLVQFSEESIAGSAAVRPAWTADRRAGAWIDRVAYTAAAIEVIRGLGKEDTDQLLLAVSLATLPLAVLQAPLALTAMFVIDLGDALVTAGRTLANRIELSADVQFATGAAAVIGTHRYDAANERSYEWVEGYFASLAGAAGAGWSGVELYEGVLSANRKAAIKQGRELSEGVSFATLNRLNRENLEAILQAMKHAGAVAARAGRSALDPIERRLIALKEAIEQVRNAPPNWAAGMAPELWERIRPLARAPHVERLFREAPERMRQLAGTADGIDQLWNPHASFAEYERAVTRAQDKTAPLGPGFFAEMRGGRNPPGLTIVDRPVRSGASRGIAIRVNGGVDNAEIADFTRGLDADSEFGTGGSILELRYAKLDQDLGDDLRMVRGLGQSLTPRGTPLGLYLNMRALHGLGLRYADPQVAMVKLSYVVNVNTCVQMHAMRRAFPQATLEELAAHTFSYRYAKDFLEQTGYRVTGVSKVVDNNRRASAAGYQQAGFFASSRRAPANATPEQLTALRAQELAEFARLHGVSPNRTISFGYDIYMRIEPR